MLKQVTTQPENILKIVFQSYNQQEWRETLEIVKSLSGREFNMKGKFWTAPGLESNIKILTDSGFEFDGGKKEIVKQEPSGPPPYLAVDIPLELFSLLRPYQIDGLKFLVWRNGRGMINDDMGIGKTVQALSYLRLFPRKRPALIVCPASITIQWYREFKKWSGEKNIDILHGQTPYDVAEDCSYIINWSIISYWTEKLESMKFQVIIGDEIQAIGNNTSKRTKAFKRVAKKAPEFIAMSGTPIRSSPSQFFPILNLTSPSLFPNQYRYLQRYCNPKYNGFGWDYRGSSNEVELHELIKPLMIRRTKAEVLKDLPPKVRTVIQLDIDPIKNSDYQSYENDFRSSNSKGLALKQQLETLVWSAYHLKKEKIIDWIKDFLESGEKLVCFAYHKAVVQDLMNAFPGQVVKIDGSTSMEERTKSISRFQTDDKCRLFVGNILAAGVGIDGLQTVCSNAVFVEISWVPTDLLQAEDRLCRMGQKGSVSIYYLLATGTVEDDIMELVDKKMKIFDAVVDGKQTKDDDLLLKLIEKYRGIA